MMNSAVCCLVFLAALSSGARVDEDPPTADIDAATQAPEEQVAEEAAAPSSGEKAVVKQKGCGKDPQAPPTPLEIARAEHKKAQESQVDADAKKAEKDSKHIQATDNEDMSFVMSVIKKSAAHEQGDKAQQAQVDETSATAKRQTTVDTQNAAMTHEDESSRLATMHRQEATDAQEAKKLADDTMNAATVKTRFSKEQHELAAKAAADALAASDLANQEAEKARAWKVKSAQIRDESKQAKIARTDEAHAAAENAVHAVHLHHKAQEHLKKMKLQAANSKVALKEAREKRKDSKAAAEASLKALTQADTKAKESAWATHGSIDTLASNTASALSAFANKVNSQKEGELLVQKHIEARVAGKAATAALTMSKEAKDEADADVNETEQDLPAPDQLARVDPKGEKAIGLALNMSAEFPKDEEEEAVAEA